MNAFPTLARLISLQDQAPFDSLLAYLKETDLLSNATEHLHGTDFNCSLPSTHQAIDYRFVAQTQCNDDPRYYEQIIFEDKTIPTRDNWHDFFNALIWSQFTQCKAYFNQQHILQLQESPQSSKAKERKASRTPVRDRITHFDECGLLIITNDAQVEPLIEAHQWQALFIDKKDNWHTSIKPVIVGHALWEMLLSPFIGLTAKATVITLDSDSCETLCKLKQSAFFEHCDQLLLDHLNNHGLLQRRKPWLPLPMLGIPKWSPFTQDQAFYENTHYFMPKR